MNNVRNLILNRELKLFDIDNENKAEKSSFERCPRQLERTQ
jgi:hypothetical protein